MAWRGLPARSSDGLDDRSGDPRWWLWMAAGLAGLALAASAIATVAALAPPEALFATPGHRPPPHSILGAKVQYMPSRTARTTFPSQRRSGAGFRRSELPQRTQDQPIA